MSPTHSPKQAAWTPGPWQAIEVRTQVGRAFRIGAGEMLVAGKGCCIIYDDYCSNPENERSANAHLIAAAPELFEALEEARTTIAMLRRNVVTEIEKHDGLFRWEGVPEALQGRIDQCDAALSKARPSNRGEA